MNINEDTVNQDVLYAEHKTGRDRRAADQLVLARFHATQAGRDSGPLSQAILGLLHPDDVARILHGRRETYGEKVTQAVADAKRELTDALRFLDEAETILGGE